MKQYRKIDIVETDKVQSVAEDLFVQLFCEAFGPEYAGELFTQHPFVDIYGRHRYIDFALESSCEKIAIEIDGEHYHNPALVSPDKYVDDLLKQNSLVYADWKIFRWTYRQLRDKPELVKDELTTFLSKALLHSSASYLPEQKGSTIQFRDYQEDALEELARMRSKGETIALLYHATGVGKTIVAVEDARRIGGKTLFLVNSLKLADQAIERFKEVWPESEIGKYTGSEKTCDSDVVIATIQSVVRNLEDFTADQFKYLIIDECHHAASKSYSKILGYFKPDFTLGLSATPDREDGEDILALFKNVAHKMDLETAVKRGILAPIRCFRVKTNVDLSQVRINGIQYNSTDLESKLFVPERNRLIVDTYMDFAQGHHCVIFCASVNHADDIRNLLLEKGVKAESVSGRLSESTRTEILRDYEESRIEVLCACDLLNEGWDSPQTDVLFMARPTMSRALYMQQLGRGVRKHEGKESVLVFDFVDNAGLFNMPYSLHRILNIGQYRPFQLVLAPDSLRTEDEELYRKGERPAVLLDLPIYTSDYEPVELFNWQEKAKTMISQMELVRQVDVQSETIDRYIKEGKIKGDLVVPFTQTRHFHYFTKDTIYTYVQKFGWTLITSQNIKGQFQKFVEKMDMSYSYKPVLLLAVLDNMDENGRVSIEAIVSSFREFYSLRRASGKVVEKEQSLFCHEGFTDVEAKKNILSNPFKRFADMRFLTYSKDLDFIEFNRDIFKRLTEEDYQKIRVICHQKLDEYYKRLA